MAKSDKSALPQLTRKQRSRREKEALYRRWLIAGTAVVLLAVAIVLGWAIYDAKFVQPRRPVAIVNGDKIALDDYQRQVQYSRLVYQSQINQLQAQLNQIDPEDEAMSFMYQIYQQQLQTYEGLLAGAPTNTLQSMIQDRVIRQEAARRGIAVTDDEIQVDIEEQFNYYRNPPTPEPTATAVSNEVTLPVEGDETTAASPTPAPTATPVTRESFEEQWAGYVEQINSLTGFTEQDYRDLVAARLYEDRVREAIEQEAPTTAEQVHARHILVETEEEALGIIERLEAGDEFSLLAKELSLDTGSAAEGGDLGWFTRETMVAAFSEAAFSLEPGQVSEPVQTDYGYHIILVEAHEMDRALEGADLTTAQRQYYEDWLLEQTQAEGVVTYWSADMVPPASGVVR